MLLSENIQIGGSIKSDILRYHNHYIGPAICVLAVLVSFAYIHHIIGGSYFPNDDAFIALHNAQVLWSGSDPSYHGVPALVGATSGVHLALLMLFESIIHPDTTALFVLGAVIGAVYLLGLYVAFTNVGCSHTEATVLTLAGLAFGGSLFQLLNGLDTGLAMAAIAWNIAFITGGKSKRWLPLLCGVMFFVRPELAFLSLGSMAIVLADRELPRNSKLEALLLCALGALPFLLWYWIDTGSPIPSTISAKTYFFAERFIDWREKSTWLYGILGQALLVVFPLFFCFVFARPRTLQALFLLFAAVFIASFSLRFPHGLMHNGNRYLFPFAPVVLFGVACGLSSSRRWHRHATLACIGISLLFVPFGFRFEVNDYRDGVNGFRASITDIVGWMDAHLAPKTRVMVHDAGYAAYAGDFTLIDVAGLKTPASAEIHEQLTYPSAGALRAEAIARIAADFGPQYLMVTHGWNEQFGFATALRSNGWNVEQIYVARAPPETPAWMVYELYRLTPPRR
jgi:hypothetical protein